MGLTWFTINGLLELLTKFDKAAVGFDLVYHKWTTSMTGYYNFHLFVLTRHSKVDILSNQNVVGKMLRLHSQTMCSWSKFLINFMGKNCTLAFENHVFMVKLLLCMDKLKLHS